MSSKYIFPISQVGSVCSLTPSKKTDSGRNVPYELNFNIIDLELSKFSVWVIFDFSYYIYIRFVIKSRAFFFYLYIYLSGVSGIQSFPFHTNRNSIIFTFLSGV